MAARQLRMWSKKPRLSRIDGGRGIGAISDTAEIRSVAAGALSARSPASCSPSGPSRISSNNVTPGATAWITSPLSTPVRCPSSLR